MTREQSRPKHIPGLAAFQRSRPRRSRRPALESLEGRALLTTYTIGPNDVASLIQSIETANTNGQSNTINLAAGSIYTLNTVDNFWYGPNGLPAITSTITIEGNGATIQRSTVGSTPNFRLFYISAGFSANFPA